MSLPKESLFTPYPGIPPSYTDMDPQVYGSNVVWYGYEEGGSDREIFLYDGNGITQLTHNSYNDGGVNRGPQIYGSNVVWQGSDGSDEEIFLYDGSTTVTTQLTNNSYNDLAPKIYGSNVLWHGLVG